MDKALCSVAVDRLAGFSTGYVAGFLRVRVASQSEYRPWYGYYSA